MLQPLATFVCGSAVLQTAYTRPGCAEPAGETATPPGIESQAVCAFETGTGAPHASMPETIEQVTMYTADVVKSWYSRYTAPSTGLASGLYAAIHGRSTSCGLLEAPLGACRLATPLALCHVCPSSLLYSMSASRLPLMCPMNTVPALSAVIVTSPNVPSFLLCIYEK